MGRNQGSHDLKARRKENILKWVLNRCFLHSGHFWIVVAEQKVKT